MLRRFLFAAMLFVLLWTSTFLHDIAEPDEYGSIQRVSDASAAAEAICFKSQEQLSSEGHCHDVLVVSKFEPPQPCFECPQNMLRAHGIPLSISARMVGAHGCTRAPPAMITFARTKLYIFNQALLI